MMARTVHLLSIHDYVVTDRSLFDVVMYEVALRGWTRRAETFLAMAEEFYNYHAAHIVWAEKGYAFKEERYRLADPVYIDKSRAAASAILDRICPTNDEFGTGRLRLHIVDLTQHQSLIHLFS